MNNTQKALLLPALGVLILGGGALAGYASLAAAQGEIAGGTQGFGPMRMFQRAPHVDGTITSISGTTITITAPENHGGGTYTIDGSQATFMKDGSAATIGNFAVGDTIFAEGEVNDSRVAATKILAGGGMKGFGGRGSHGPGKGPGAVGKVTAVNGSTITVEGRDGSAYTVDASSAQVQKMVAGSLSDIQVGDTIGVQGTKNGSTITARNIMDDVPETLGTPQ